MAKIDTQFVTKTAENHTLWDRHTYLAHIREYPPPPGGNNLLFSYYKLGFRCFESNLFSYCFDLRDLNLEKPFRILEEGLTVCPATYSI